MVLQPSTHASAQTIGEPGHQIAEPHPHFTRQIRHDCTSTGQLVFRTKLECALKRNNLLGHLRTEPHAEIEGSTRDLRHADIVVQGRIRRQNSHRELVPFTISQRLR
ncbi:hypothetical protein CLV40_12614 [Actinokineospora auranticolor]|uniref:Uncharacterized protein n=1 Tax=Actinokineospora auranticolor TaxID=155976 RepID=A0A2S6GEE2_9PSEU|nr:hypothetical protein CLV40_12614 [Actinokineospora auranticolor]